MRAHRTVAAVAAMLLPLAVQANVFAVYDNGRTTFALSDTSHGSCTGDWQTAYVVTYGNIPSCWTLDQQGRISICPAPKGQKFVAAGCYIFSRSLFVEPASLPRQARFPK